MKTLVLLCLSGVVLVAGCPGDSSRCTADRTAVFYSVSDGQDVVDETFGGVRVERLSGDLQGYHEGLVVSLLVYDGAVRFTPPCQASEVEVVLDQTQVGLSLEVFESGSDVPFHTDFSETASGLEPDVGNFVRWTIAWPNDRRAASITLSNGGSAGFSTLIKSVTFR